MLIRELINPKSIVVVGGSNNLNSPGGRILQNIIQGKYQGELMVVNPKSSGEKIQGILTVGSIEDLPSVELAIIAIPAPLIKENVQKLVEKKNTRAFIILSAGFSEMGEEGRRLEKEIVELVNRVNGSLIGPNCIGVLTTNYAGIFAGPVPQLHPLGCDFVSGSGATAAFIIEKGIALGITFSSLYSVGNGAQICVEDVVQFWDEHFDPQNSPKIKLIYIENIQRPKVLLKHCASLISKGCRVAAVKAGQTESGERAASSHTGALANSDLAVDALLKKAGVVRCYGREDLLSTAAIFCDGMLDRLYHKCQQRKNDTVRNIAIITHAGGPGVMLADALSKTRQKVINIPVIKGEKANHLLSELFVGSTVQNPIDFLATGTLEQLEKIITFVENDCEEIDGMVIIFGHSGINVVKPIYQMIDQQMKKCNKAIWVVMPSVTSGKEDIDYFRSLGRVYFDDEVTFGYALGKILELPPPTFENKIDVSAEKENLAINVERIRQLIENSDLGEKDGHLPPQTVQGLLDAAGIPRVPEEIVHTMPSALSAFTKCMCSEVAAKNGCVMKVIGPIHKTEVGGVALSISTPEEIQYQFSRLMAIDGAEGVLMQPMVKGTELFLGAKREAGFGHLILCGLGGILVEVLKDVATGMVPINSTDDVLSMIHSLRGYPLIQGVRGKAGVDEKKFAQIILRLSKLLEHAPEIEELDLNPLIGSPEGVVVVDARVRISK
ncbi:MAG: acetate--CoA ligase family protein [Oligoflexia bacterium]|nr:acetate--CoA ligase family protein [Oligoflexia bacterium]